MIRAKPGPQQAVDALKIWLDDGGFAAGNAPSDAPSGGEVILGQSAESNDRHVGRDGGHGDVRVVINNQFVVNLIGKDDQVVPARQFGNLLEHLARTDGAGRIVGIDQHNAARARRDLLLDVVEIGLPAVFFVQVIGVESDVDLRQNRGIERIVRARSQQVVARIEQRGQADVHRLADARGDEDILNVGDPLAGRLAANRVERFLDT